MGKPVSAVSTVQPGGDAPVSMRGLGSASPVPVGPAAPMSPVAPALPAAPLRPSNGPQAMPVAANAAGSNAAAGAGSGSLPVDQNALNYLNSWYAGTPQAWGAPAPAPAAVPLGQNNVVPKPRNGNSHWNVAPPPAPTTASLMQPQAPAPAQAPPQQQNPNWSQLYGNGPNQFAQGFNPLAGNPNGANGMAGKLIMPGPTGLNRPGNSGAMGAPLPSAY